MFSRIKELWNVIKALIAWFKSGKEQKIEEDKQAAQEISQTLNSGYQKIDEEKEELKQDEDLDSVEEDLNNIF